MSEAYGISNDKRNNDNHTIMPMEQQYIAERHGNIHEVLHDNRMMIAVNNVKLLADNDSLGNYLVADITIRSTYHTLPLSPNLFEMKTDTGDTISPSIYHTSLLNTGLEQLYLPEGLTIRTLVAFESPIFNQDGNNSIQIPESLSLEYNDRSSIFEIELDYSKDNIFRQIPLAAESLGNITINQPIVYTAKIGEEIRNGSLQLSITNITSSPINVNNNYGNNSKTSSSEIPSLDNKGLKISLTFKNIGNTSSIQIKPSYIFILDNKSHIYGVDEVNMRKLLSPLLTTDLSPSESISGDILIKLPKDVAEQSNLLFLYAGPNNSIFVRIGNTLLNS